MMAKATRKIEYKDTFNFRLFPEYKYTKEQKLRLCLFQGRVEHWRKAINYANSFPGQNQINLLYMIGYDPKMKAYLDKNTENVVILCANVPRELLSRYDEYWALVGKYKGGGYVDQDGNWADTYWKERETRENYRGTGLIPDDVYLTYDPQDKLIDEYQSEISQKIRDCFTQYILIDRIGKERTVTHEDLDYLIRKYYPRGREACGVGQKAYVSLLKINKALELGLAREDASKILDLPDAADSYESCKKGIRRCEMDLSVALRENGVVDLRSVMERMKRPPYGWSNDSHAAYSFGYAASTYLDYGWIWDEVSCFPFREVAASVLRSVIRSDTSRHSYHLITEPAYKLSSRFAYLFGIGQENYKPRDDLDEKILALHRVGLSEQKIANEIGTMSSVAVHYRINRMRIAKNEDVPLINMSTAIFRKIEETTRWPISLLDERLHDTLLGKWDNTKYVSIPVMGKRKEREELSYFTAEKCKGLKKQIDRINEIAPALVRQRYGNGIDMDAVKSQCTTKSSGWLWSSEMFWDCVDRFVQQEQ